MRREEMEEQVQQRGRTEVFLVQSTAISEQLLARQKEQSRLSHGLKEGLPKHRRMSKEVCWLLLYILGTLKDGRQEMKHRWKQW